MKKAVFIVGPTGSGKSSLALALAKELKTEIISADSMQIYRGMDIGTDKPSRWTRYRVKHHLINILPPSREFSVCDFRERVFLLLEKMNQRKKVPLVVGGTGLYLKAVLDGISPQPGKDEKVRLELEEEKKLKGLSVLYERLQKFDPPVARRVHANDAKRIIRALEIFEVSGRRMSDWEKETEPIEKYGYRALVLGIERDRAELYKRIDARVDEMFERGFVNEVRRLRGRKLSLTARQAIGYREVLDSLEGHYSLDHAREKMKQFSRNFAKRQFTWFRKDERVKWLQGADERTLLEESLLKIREFLR